MRAGFRNTEAFWREAAQMPGMTAHHADMTQFFARQWLGMMGPANWLPTNPVVLDDVAASDGAHLVQGHDALACGRLGRCPMRMTPPKPSASRSAATWPSRPARWCFATA